MVKKTIGYLWIIAGWVSFLLGLIGIFLPLLPTTPFILLAAFCFDRGSPKLHRWLINLPKVGKLIKDWNEKKVIPVYAKVIAVSMITFSIFAMWAKVPERVLYIKILVAAFMLYVVFYILRQKSK